MAVFLLVYGKRREAVNSLMLLPKEHIFYLIIASNSEASFW